MDQSLGFIAQEDELVFKNAKAVIDLSFPHYYNDGTIFDFFGYVSAYLRIYDGGGEQLLKSFTTQLSRNANNIVMNASVSDMTFENTGNYYYEMGYVRNGAYDVATRYGTLEVIP